MKRKSQQTSPNYPPLQRGLVLSVSLHIALALFAVVKTVFFPSNVVMHIPSLKVDLVALPDQLSIQKSTQIAKKLEQAPVEQEKPAPAPEPPPAPKAPEPTAMELQKKKKEAQDKKKKAQEKKDKENNERKMQASLEKIRNRNLRTLKNLKSLEKIKGTESDLVRGNHLSDGSSTSADARENAKFSYLDLIKDQIQAHWSLPPWLARQKLNAQVRVFIDSQGGLRSFSFVRSSSSEQFDEAVSRALNSSQPFPKPPEQIDSELLRDGILVGFPL